MVYFKDILVRGEGILVYTGNTDDVSPFAEVRDVLQRGKNIFCDESIL